MEMDLQTEQGQTVEEELQAVEAEPDSSGDSPEEERTYSQREVEEIIREHLKRFQSLPDREPQQAEALATRELNLEKRNYLQQKIHVFAQKVPPFRGCAMVDGGTPYGYFCDNAAGLYGFLEAEKLDCFTKSVDTVFELLDFIREVSFDAGYSQCSEKYEDSLPVQKPNEEVNIVREIFRMGGHV